MKIVFIDNGVTGTIGMYNGGEGSIFIETPHFSQQDYTGTKKNITRINVNEFANILLAMKGTDPCLFVLERPMVNPKRFTASESALRAHEAMNTVFDLYGLPFKVVDSKSWQRGLLPSSGKRGVDSATLKEESKDIGLRLFPQFRDLILKHKDADGILGAYIYWKKENIQ